MNFDFNEFINLAINLNENKDEASKRSAVSRSYYGALMLTKAYLVEIGEKLPTSGSSHEDIWFTLMKLGGKEKIIANTGLALKKQRIVADYNPRIDENLASWSNLQMAKAKSIINDLVVLRNQKKK